MWPSRWLVVLILSSLPNIICGDIFASVVDLKNALLTEQLVINSLKEYVEAEFSRLVEVSDIIDGMETTNQKSIENPDLNLANIIAGFQTIARLTLDWKEQLDKILSENNQKKLMDDIATHTLNKYPEPIDLRRAADSVFRLQDVYAMTPEQFANGSIAKNAAVMSAKDCLQVADAAMGEFDYYHATMWYEQALKMSKLGDETVDRLKLYQAMVFAYYRGGIMENIGYIVRLCKEILSYDPDNEFAKNNLQRYERKLQKTIEVKSSECDGDKLCEKQVARERRNSGPVFQRNRREFEAEDTYKRFETLCRGEDEHVPSGLTCSYRRHNPMHVLLPLKEELYSIDPFVAVYHDFTTEEEISFMHKYAEKDMHRSVILGTFYSDDKDTFHRTSKTAWIDDDVHPIVERLTQRSLSIGNLSVETTEKMQLVCYGLGGHYSPHYDWAKDEDFTEGFGNRVATVLHYLSDPVGGATAFINLGVKVTPKRGSTLFWWNLHKNLTGDTRSLHAGCPVIYGNKWIANKWVHRNGQAFHRPCSLDPME